MGGETVERSCSTCRDGNIAPVHACAECGDEHKYWLPIIGGYPEDRLTKVDVASAFKAQVGGNHYTKWKIQPFQLSMDNHLDPMQHTIIKYVMRFRDKNGIEDLRKAIHTIQLLAEYEYNERI